MNPSADSKPSNESTQDKGAAYSAHITAVCAAMNAGTQSLTPPGASKRARRRETNRLSAQRCRKKRKEELLLLIEEVQRLSAETEQLTAEKERLQQELQEETARVYRNSAANPATYLRRPHRGALSHKPAIILPPRQLHELTSIGGILHSSHLSQIQGTPFLQIAPGSVSLHGILSRTELPSGWAHLDSATRLMTLSSLEFCQTDRFLQSRNLGSTNGRFYL
jgi:hypothetical protein